MAHAISHARRCMGTLAMQVQGVSADKTSRSPGPGFMLVGCIVPRCCAYAIWLPWSPVWWRRCCSMGEFDPVHVLTCSTRWGCQPEVRAMPRVLCLVEAHQTGRPWLHC